MSLTDEARTRLAAELDPDTVGMVERRLVERRGALYDDAAINAWVGDMERRARDRRLTVTRLSALDPSLTIAGRPASRPAGDLTSRGLGTAAGEPDRQPSEAPDHHAPGALPAAADEGLPPSSLVAAGAMAGVQGPLSTPAALSSQPT